MNRIFATLAVVANSLLAAVYILGWMIGDATSMEPAARAAVNLHFLLALGSGVFVLLVHAVVLTYLMGTGRWIEETSIAYHLGDQWRGENVRLKYRTLPGMVACMALVVVTGAFGAIADPGSSVSMAGAATVHFALATATLLGNVFVSYIEYLNISQNGGLVARVYARVKQIRREKGLDVDAQDQRRQQSVVSAG